MAKKRPQQPQKKITWLDILKGNFLNREEVKSNYKLYLLIGFFFLLMIYNNHLVVNKIKEINTLKEKKEEYKSRNALVQSKLIKIKMESELGKHVVADSLMTLESHPHKLLIKLDTTDAQSK